MKHSNDKDAYNEDYKEHIRYNQKIAKAKNELKTRLPPRAFKKKELWELNKTKWQIMKINGAIAWRSFDLKTRGMGLYLLCLMGIMMIVMILPIVADSVTHELNKSKYQNALKTSCLDTTFYSWNFRACEDIDVRPFAKEAPEIRGNQV